MYSIKATKKGFCVGGSSKHILLYELDKSFMHNLVMGSNQKITNNFEETDNKIIRIHSSSNDGFFTVTTTNEIGAYNFFFLNVQRIDVDISSLDQFFASGFHNKKINSLSRSVTKQLLASCSEDNNVKIWNFFDVEGYQKKGLISYNFPEEPLSVSMVRYLLSSIRVDYS